MHLMKTGIIRRTSRFKRGRYNEKRLRLYGQLCNLFDCRVLLGRLIIRSRSFFFFCRASYVISRPIDHTASNDMRSAFHFNARNTRTRDRERRVNVRDSNADKSWEITETLRRRVRIVCFARV